MSRKITRPTEAEVLAAHKVLGAFNHAAAVDKEVQLRKLVGKFYRTDNSSGAGKSWWLYFAVTGVKWGASSGWTFQKTTDNEIQIRLTDRQYIDGRASWKEVTPARFWREAHKVAAIVAERLEGKGAA